MPEPDDALHFARRLRAQKRFYALFFGGLALYVPLLLAGLHSLAFGVGGVCLVTAGVVALLYRSDVRVGPAEGKLLFFTGMTALPPRVGAWMAATAGVGLIVWGGFWLVVALALLR